MFKTYTGWQYLLIDAATQYGLDKLTFEERIQWTESNMGQLDTLALSAENRPLYLKAVQAIRKAKQGLPTGHMVGVDGCCSGIQVMSALTGCIAGATATGLVNPNVRADAYSACTEAMNTILGGSLNVPRKDAKKALMTSFYGSTMQPKAIFGEDNSALHAFYKAAQAIAPGAWDLLQTLLASWQPYAKEHYWKLPDGFDSHVKVMKKVETRIEVDELDHSTFTYEYYENEGSKEGLSNAANVVHSVDAYILRSMHRRCNYDRQEAEYVSQCIETELIERSIAKRDHGVIPDEYRSKKVDYYIQQYERSTLADIVILPHLDQMTVGQLSKGHLQALAEIINGMLQYKPFELVTIH